MRERLDRVEHGHVQPLHRARQYVPPQMGLVDIDSNPQIPRSLAASSAPRPQGPATWNTTRDPFAIWLRATDLPFTGSWKSSV